MNQSGQYFQEFLSYFAYLRKAVYNKNVNTSPQKSSLYQGIVLSVLFLACVGVTYYNRGFVKLHAGPLYILEIIYLVWLASIFLSKKSRAEFVSIFFFKHVIPLWLFFFYSLCLFSFDFAFPRGNEPLSRVLQHALLFIYPALWVPVGYWLQKSHPEKAEILMLVVLATVVPSYLFNIYGNFEVSSDSKIIGSNFAIGPLAGTLAAYVLCERKALYAILATMFLAFVPYWILLHDHMKRITLLQLFLAIILVPLMHSRLKVLAALKNSLILTLVFLLGCVISLQFSKTGIQATLTNSLRHGDDRPTVSMTDLTPVNAAEPLFQARSRRFWWETAIRDWKERPFFGRGFLPEIPSYYYVGLKNDGNFSGVPGLESLNNTPIAGPHNSYLGILARTGVVGTVLFGFFLCTVFASLVRFAFSRERHLRLSDHVLIMVLVNGFFYAFLGTGFESPHNAFVLWLFTGILLKK